MFVIGCLTRARAHITSRPDLIEKALGKCNPVFNGDDGHAPLLPAVLLVKLVDGTAACVVVRLDLAFLPAAMQVVWAELKLVVGEGRPLVHVELPNLRQNSGISDAGLSSFLVLSFYSDRTDLICRASQQRGHIFDHVLQDQDALGHAKAPEGRVGGQVGPAGGGAAP